MRKIERPATVSPAFKYAAERLSVSLIPIKMIALNEAVSWRIKVGSKTNPCHG
jgi:hypothetical protein